MLLIVILLYVNPVHSLGCVDAYGRQVDWWVIIKIPPSISSGYLIMQSNSQNQHYTYSSQQVDKTLSALSLTLLGINQYKMQYVAWNDQKPNGSVSATSAHSKGVIAYGQDSGYYLLHSIPKYPEFVEGKVSPIINQSQQIFAQNMMCLSMNIYSLDHLATKISIMKPFIYAHYINPTLSTQNLYLLSQSVFIRTVELFEYEHWKNFNYDMTSIFKNGRLNGSIFEDAFVDYFQSSLILAETWGRPLDKPWCTSVTQILNVKQLGIDGINWNQTQDHSKWVLIDPKYVCFGDMNHMKSQWKRGGSYHCIANERLYNATSVLILNHDSCS